MKTMLKLTLVIALFGSMAMADDGQMGSGGFAACTENCSETEQSAANITTTTSEDILFFVNEYLELNLSF